MSNSFTYLLRTNDFDQSDLFKYSSLLDLFQDVASRHAVSQNISFDEMNRKGYYWVIARIRTKLFFHPRSIDSVKVITNVTKAKNDYELIRTFKAYVNNKLMSESSSIWVLIDKENRKLAKLPLDLLSQN